MQIILLIDLSELMDCPVYFPGAAFVIAAKMKWEKYIFLINHNNQKLVPFVIEVRYKGDGGTVRDRFLRDSFQIYPLFLIEYHVIFGQTEYLCPVLELQLVT